MKYRHLRDRKRGGVIQSVVCPSVVIVRGVNNNFRGEKTGGVFGSAGGKKGTLVPKLRKPCLPQSTATVVRRDDKYALLSNGQGVRSDHRLATRTTTKEVGK